MRTIVKGKNFEVPESDRRYAERKLARLERILDDRSDAVVELSVEQHRNQERGDRERSNGSSDGRHAWLRCSGLVGRRTPGHR